MLRRTHIARAALALLTVAFGGGTLRAWQGPAESAASGTSARTAPETAEDEQTLANVVEALASVDEQATPTQNARPLLDLGPEAIRASLSILFNGALPGSVEGSATAPIPLSEAQREALLMMLDRSPREALFSQLSSLVRDGIQGSRVHAFELLGVHAKRKDVALFVECAADRERSSSESDALISGLASTFEREAHGISELYSLWTDLEPELKVDIARSLGRTGGVRALEFLSDALRESRGAHTSQLIVEAGRLAPWADVDHTEELGDLLVPLISMGNERSVRAASILALGKLDAHDAADELIELLDEELDGIRDNAQWALSEMTGLSYEGSRRWQRWYDKESDWLTNDAENQFDRLRSESPSEVADALRIIARHRLQRDELSANVKEALSHESPSIRAMACHTLGQIGSRRVVNELVEALDDEPNVRQAAAQALQRITGKELPAERDAWSEAVLRG